MPKAVKSKIMYLLVILAMLAGILAMPTAASATEPMPFPTSLDVYFQAFSHLSGEAPLTVTFTNLTTGGAQPYTKAEWDFNGDGVSDKTLTGTQADVTQPVTYTFNESGIYNMDVTLQMTDSTPTSKSVMIRYAICVGGISGDSWHCNVGGEPLVAPVYQILRPRLSGVVACSDIIVPAGAELWGIYYLDEASGTWLYYIPGFAGSTLTTLDSKFTGNWLHPSKTYYVVVSAPCVLFLPFMA
jgi:hypothetical protein